MQLLKTTRSSAVFWVPLIYAMVIISYPMPETYDISRFVRYYHVFARPNSSWDEIQKILFKTPDILSQLMELALAKAGIPIHVFFFIITYLTVLNFLLVFSAYYQKEKKRQPRWYFFILIMMAISVPAVLSGIRNIHALSFVALAFLFYSQRKLLPTGLCLLYAALFHYSVYIIIAAFLLYNLGFFKKRIRYIEVGIIFSLFLGIAGIYLLPLTEGIVPKQLFLKLHYYLIEHSYFIEKFQQLNIKGKAVFVFNIIFPLLFLGIYFWRIYKGKIDLKLPHEITVIGLCVSIFLFFPNTMSRYWMLLYIYLLFNTILNSKPKELKAHSILVIGLFIFQHLLFWNAVYFPD